MTLKPIRNDDDYKEALARIESLMHARADTPDGDLLDILVTLVEAYERKIFPLDNPDPVEAIKFYMEQNNLAPDDLQPLIGKSDRVHEVLNRKRPLNLRMIRNIHKKFGIPAEILIQEAHLVQEA